MEGHPPLPGASSLSPLGGVGSRASTDQALPGTRSDRGSPLQPSQPTLETACPLSNAVVRDSRNCTLSLLP
jgi:hypothetical protein